MGPATVGPPSRFSHDTAVEPLGDGRYRARMDPSWWIIAGPNGGYVAATVLRAVLHAVDAGAPSGDAGGAPPRRARSATFHYLRPPAEGEVEIQVSLDRVGRSVVNTSAAMVQDGRTLVQALVTVAADRGSPVTFDEDPGLPRRGDGSPVPTPEELPAEDLDPERTVPMRDHYELRWVLGDLPFRPGSSGRRSFGAGAEPRALCGGWIRLTDPDPVDEVVLCAMSDAWLPPVFSRVEIPLAVPTIDLTVHFRGRPPADDPWCFVEFTSPVARDGYVVEHGRLHDRHGVLLAESRQLAVMA